MNPEDSCYKDYKRPSFDTCSYEFSQSMEWCKPSQQNWSGKNDDTDFQPTNFGHDRFVPKRIREQDSILYMSEDSPTSQKGKQMPR